jgi:hypothetical protein
VFTSFLSLGEWSEGRWHGQGRASFNNGDTYDGLYSYDQRHGKGTYAWSDGRVYSGGFVADRREGHGVYTWPDGAKYEGYFKDGQHDGQGSYKVCVNHDACMYEIEIHLSYILRSQVVFLHLIYLSF